jgi:RNA polymerase sigma-70 factor (ECF subfamily)
VGFSNSHALDVGLRSAIEVSGQESQMTLDLEQEVANLFHALRGSIYRYLLCRSMSPSEAEEIVQEAFLRLYHHLASGGKEDNLRAWLFRVAHNIGINEIKKRKYADEFLSRQWTDLDSAPNPEEALLHNERLSRVSHAISTLSEQQRQCLYLRAEGLPHREIADILGVNVSTVAQSLHRAIKKIIKESHAEPPCE